MMDDLNQISGHKVAHSSPSKYVPAHLNVMHLNSVDTLSFIN